MPTNIFNLAKIYEEELSKLLKKETKPLNQLLKRSPEPSDEEIIQIIENIKKEQESKYTLTNFFQGKNKIANLVSNVTNFVEEKLFAKKKYILVCRNFLIKAKNHQHNCQQSSFYKLPHEILVQIFQFLYQHELAQTAKTTEHFANIIKINKFLLNTSAMPRDYNQIPSSVKTWKLNPTFEIPEIENYMSCYYLLIPSKMQLLVGMNDTIDIRNAFTGEKILDSLKMDKNIAVTCLARFSDTMILSGGKNLSKKETSRGIILIWDIKNGKCLNTIKSEDPINHLLVSLNDKVWSASTNKIRRWHITTWAYVEPFEITLAPHEKIQDLVEIPTKNQLIVATTSNLLVYNIKDDDTKDTKNWLFQALPQEKIICLLPLTENHFAGGTANGEIIIWYQQSPEKPWKIMSKTKVDENAISTLAAVNDKLIYGSVEGIVRIFNWKKSTFKKLILRNSDSKIRYIGFTREQLVSITYFEVQFHRFPPVSPQPTLKFKENEDESEPINTSRKTFDH